MPGPRRQRTEIEASFLSLAGVIFLLVASALTQLVHSVQPPLATPVACETPPPLAVSLPVELPAAATTPLMAAPIDVTPAVAPAVTASAVTTPTPATTAPVVVAVRQLFRADDPPGDHGLAVSYGTLLPAVIPAACQVPAARRRPTAVPCVKLLPPGQTLCASGLVGEGQLTTESAGSAFALQIDRVTLRDVDGALRIDAPQGYVRYDDRIGGLALVCPRIAYIEPVGSNALRFIALCSNEGAEGWSVSGQVTDGATAAPDSMSLTVDAPDGTETALIGSVTNGVVLMRNGPVDASPGP